MKVQNIDFEFLRRSATWLVCTLHVHEISSNIRSILCTCIQIEGFGNTKSPQRSVFEYFPKDPWTEFKYGTFYWFYQPILKLVFTLLILYRQSASLFVTNNFTPPKYEILCSLLSRSQNQAFSTETWYWMTFSISSHSFLSHTHSWIFRSGGCLGKFVPLVVATVVI